MRRRSMRPSSDAFPGAAYRDRAQRRPMLELEMRQHGLLRALTRASSRTERCAYLLWIAALLTPRPPALMVLNEPETSLHPDLLPALARLILGVGERRSCGRLALGAADRGAGRQRFVQFAQAGEGYGRDA